MRANIKYATVEFSGAKFKTKATTGDDNMMNIQEGIIGSTLKDFLQLKRIVICEEKYSFTPDDFKAATRLKRQKTSATSVTHLKEAHDILSDDKLAKSAVVNTVLGKRLISNYLARRVSSLNLKIKDNLILDVDSELVTKTMPCLNYEGACACPEIPFTVPVRAVFRKDTGFLKQYLLEDIKQRKGEAELAQVDWLSAFCQHPEEDEAFLSIVTSGDIDSIIIHLFACQYIGPEKPMANSRIKSL